MAKIDQQSGGLRPGNPRQIQDEKHNKLFIVSNLQVIWDLAAKMPYSSVGQEEVAYEEHV